jgi:Co/Zn/Cd efflux system component
VLNWLESTQLAVWLAESGSVWAFPTVLTLHTAGMALLVGASWVLDLRLLGISRRVPLSSYRWVFSASAIGLFVNVVTGVLLFTKNATKWGTALPFFVKMFLVIASVATLVPLRSHVLRNGADDEGNEVHGTPRLLAIASILAWAGAVTAGRLLAYLVL